MKNATTVPTAPLFLKAGPLAKQVGVTPKTLHRWHAAGHFSARKVSARVVLFPVEEVLGFINAARVCSSAK